MEPVRDIYRAPATFCKRSEQEIREEVLYFVACCSIFCYILRKCAATKKWVTEKFTEDVRKMQYRSRDTITETLNIISLLWEEVVSRLA